MSGNYFRLISLLVFIIVYCFSLLPIQLKEVWRPDNFLRPMSYFILAILSIGLITLIPSTVLQASIVSGASDDVLKHLRTLSTYTSTIGGIANIVLLWLIFHYKMKD